MDHHIRDFSESEALHGWLNYRQGSLRARVEHGLQPPPAAEEYRDLLRGQQVIGATGDVARVLLLPGATQWFTPGDARAALRAVDYPFAYRVGLFAGFLLPWLKQRLMHR